MFCPSAPAPGNPYSMYRYRYVRWAPEVVGAATCHPEDPPAIALGIRRGCPGRRDDPPASSPQETVPGSSSCFPPCSQEDSGGRGLFFRGVRPRQAPAPLAATAVVVRHPLRSPEKVHDTMSFIGRLVNSLLNTEGSARSNGFAWATTAQEVTAGKDLTGKNYVVTGANTGMPPPLRPPPPPSSRRPPPASSTQSLPIEDGPPPRARDLLATSR